MDQSHTCETCSCKHHMVVPALVTIFGLTAVLSMLQLSWFTMNVVGWIWALCITLAGVTMLMSRSCKCCCGK